MEILQNILGHGNSALAVVLVLGGLIFFHELGHFTMARMLGMGVKTFSLGFGPRLWSIRRGKTDYCLSLIPLGGFVALAGEDADMPTAEERLDTPTQNDERVFSEQELFFARPAWQRMLVIAAGPVANFILAFIFYWLITASLGLSYLSPLVGEVLPQTPAEQAGLLPKDRIINIDGHAISEWGQISERINAARGAPVALTVERDGQKQTIHLQPKAGTSTTVFGENKQVWLAGIKADGSSFHVNTGFIAAAGHAAQRTYTMTAFTLESFLKLFQRIVPLEAVGGPIMIAQVVGQQASEGFFDVLALAALISINLGLLNLLPVPVLDGGHLVFLSLEMLFCRPVPMLVREYSTRVGVALLIGLMVLATWNDLVRLFS